MGSAGGGGGGGGCIATSGTHGTAPVNDAENMEATDALKDPGGGGGGGAATVAAISSAVMARIVPVVLSIQKHGCRGCVGVAACGGGITAGISEHSTVDVVAFTVLLVLLVVETSNAVVVVTVDMPFTDGAADRSSEEVCSKEEAVDTGAVARDLSALLAAYGGGPSLSIGGERRRSEACSDACNG